MMCLISSIFIVDGTGESDNECRCLGKRYADVGIHNTVRVFTMLLAGLGSRETENSIPNTLDELFKRNVDTRYRRA